MTRIRGSAMTMISSKVFAPPKPASGRRVKGSCAASIEPSCRVLASKARPKTSPRDPGRAASDRALRPERATAARFSRRLEASELWQGIGDPPVVVSCAPGNALRRAPAAYFHTDSFRTAGLASGLWSQNSGDHSVATHNDRYLATASKKGKPMRPMHFLLGLIVVLGSGASAYVATRLATTPQPVHADPTTEPAAAVVTDDSARIQALQAQDKLAMLDARVSELTRELESLRNSANRAPVAAVSDSVVPETVGAVAITDLQRQTVLAVLEEDRARIAAEAEAARVKQETEQAQRRASRVAKELNLSAGDEARLADLMVEGGKKMQSMRDTMRNGTFDPELARAEIETVRKWQTDQYTVAFGAAVADQILQTQDGQMRGFGGRDGGGAFAGGGGGQAGQVRGTRRGANAPGAGGTTPAGGGQTQQN